MTTDIRNEVKRKFFHYAGPSVCSMWVYTIYTMVDGMFVSRGVSTTALASVNIAMPLINLAFALGILFAVGASTRASYYKGQKKYREASEVFTTSTVTVFVLALTVSAFAMLNIDTIVRILGANSETEQYVKDYLHIIIAFVPCYMTSYNMEVLIKADGHPKKAIATVCTGAVTNIFLDYVFIMRWGLGIKGAAVATGLSQLITLLVFFHHFVRNKNGFTFVKIHWHMKEVLHYAKIGTADAVTEFSSGIMIFMFNKALLAVSGNDGVVIYTVIAYVSQLVLSTMMGINQGMQPLVSYYNGNGRPDVYKYILRVALVTAGCASAAMFLLGVIHPDPIVGFFIDSHIEPELYTRGIAAFRLFSFSYIPLGTVIILGGYFTALEYPKFAMSISLGRGLIFIMIALFIMSHLFGETGIWLTMTVSETMAFIMAVIFYIRTFHRKKKNNPLTE